MKTKSKKKRESARAKKPAAPKGKREPTEEEAAVAIARAWLGKAGFHEDASGENPERVEIREAERDASEYGGMYVAVHVYIPDLDIEHVVEGTHPDGITAEAAP